MSDGRAGWNEMAEFYDATRAFPGDGETRVPAVLADLLRSRGASRVLEIGCGTGRVAVPLARAGIRVVGIDRSPEMLAHLAGKPGARAVRVVRADAARMPFHRAFDAVVFSHFLHLVDSAEALADEVGRVLVPGALAVDLDTSYLAAPATERLLAELMPRLDATYTRWPRGDDSRDRRRFTTFACRLGAGPVEVLPCAEFPLTSTLRRELDAARRRLWWTFRRYDADAVARAAADAERALLAAGADLDAEVPEPYGVRFLVARMA